MKTITWNYPGLASLLARNRGLLQIVRFNWPFYTGAAVLIALGLAALVTLPIPLSLILLPPLAAMTFWFAASLYASHLVYDRSPLTRWTWIADLLAEPKRAANLHAGFDETSAALRRIFPQTEWRNWDFYDPLWMTEGSIARARKCSTGPVPEAVSVEALPAGDQTLDAAFLLFSAHEVRSTPLRNGFFRELRRVLRIGGRLLIVEHLRDAPNFAAFGPGCFHFYPRAEWLRLTRISGLDLIEERRMTPFVRVFLFRRRI